MNKRALLNLLERKELFLKLREYASIPKIEKAIDVILNQFDQQINKLVGQIKQKLAKLEG